MARPEHAGALSKLAEAQWLPADAASEFCDIGGVRLYRFTDPPRCSVAVGEVWVHAIFASPEAAITWARNWYDAEMVFRKSNAGRTGNKTIFLGPRGETPMTTEHQIAILTEAINKLAAAVEKLDVELRGRPQFPTQIKDWELGNTLRFPQSAGVKSGLE